VFLRFREDKDPEECVRERVEAELPSRTELSSRGASATRDLARESGRPPRRSDPAEKIPRSSRDDSSRRDDSSARTDGSDELPFELTNLKKVFWPGDGYTKGDLIAYYRAIAPWLLVYLRDRPVVLTRYPDGIAGKSFFQKDAPGFRPEWIRTERMWSEDTQREIDYFVCDDAASLLYIINLGSIPLHLWASRAPALERPDWCVLDLDPKGAPFAHVVEVALAARELCRRIDLPVLVKTTGSTGLHLKSPLGRQCTHEQSRSLGELLARCLVDRLPEITTIARQVSQREGKVYVDYLQNGSGKLIVAPFSVRPLPGAPVSVPLAWREVNWKLDIRSHTIETVPGRMRKLGADPLAQVLELSPDLVGALERLVGELG
jgi:bifunctional non-homologous end joining protein LigD